MQSSFESVVEQLGLSRDEYQHSMPLKKWVLQNMDSRYVPSDLLEAWGLVEPDEDRKTAA